MYLFTILIIIIIILIIIYKIYTAPYIICDEIALMSVIIWYVLVTLAIFHCWLLHKRITGLSECIYERTVCI